MTPFIRNRHGVDVQDPDKETKPHDHWAEIILAARRLTPQEIGNPFHFWQESRTRVFKPAKT
jgi:hypothetical protein